jgi:hypothetical protein
MLRAWRITPPEPASQETIEGRQVNHGDNPLNPFLASFTVPYRFHAVETILPRILGDDPKISYEARDHDRDDPVAKIMTCLVQEQLEDMDFDLKARDFVRQALIKNYSVAKVYWRKETQQTTKHVTQQHTDPEYPGVKYQTEVEQPDYVTLVDEPGFEVVDVRDFVWPLTANTIQSAPAVWQRRWVLRSYLMRMEAAGFYHDISKVGAADATSQWRKSRERELDTQNLTPTQPADRDVQDPDDLIEIWERWTNDHLYVIADPRGDAVAIRDEPSPFSHGRKPFVDYAPIPVLGQLHGISIVRTIYDLAEDLDTKRRQFSDNITMGLDRMWAAVRGEVDEADLVRRPGGVVWMESADSLTPLAPAQIDLAGFAQYESRVYDDMQRTSGASTYLDGTALANQSATGVATIVQEGNKRLTEMIKVFDRRAMRELARQMFKNNEHFLDEGVAVDLSKDPQAAQAFQEYIRERQGEEGTAPNGITRVSSEMLRPEGRLRPISVVGQDYEVSKQQKQSAAVQLGAAIAPFVPVLLQQGWDFKAFADYMMEEMAVPDDVRNAVKAAPPPPPAPPPAPSGPSGENLPTGLAQGAVGAPGPAGAYGQATNGNG